MKYQIKKSVMGISIRYQCPYCQVKLRAALDDAGTKQICEDCGRSYVVPGQEDKAKAEAIKQEKLEQAEIAKRERKEAKAAQQRELQLQKQREIERRDQIPEPAVVVHESDTSLPPAGRVTLQTSQGPTTVNTQVVLANETSNSFGIAGFVTSIVAFFTCGFISPVAILLSAIGLRHPNKGLAVGGIVLGCFGLVPMAFIILNMLAVGAAVSNTPHVLEQMEQERIQTEKERVRKAKEAETMLQLVKLNSVTMERDRFSNSIKFSLSNELDEAISKMMIGVTVREEGRSVHYGQDAVYIEISGGLEPGESKEWNGTPGYGSDLRDCEIPENAIIEGIVFVVFDANGERLYDATETIGSPYMD